MTKILFITTLYPIPHPENNATPVCHYYTREWVEMGCEVIVIHVQPVHCMAWHLLVKFFGKTLENWAGGGNFYSKRLNSTEHYEMDGVEVYRIPTYNFIPHGRFPRRSVKKLVSEIGGILKMRNFIPQVITGHMLDLDIIPELNKNLGAKTCMVSHGIPKKIKERYPDWRELIESYDIWGFRSSPIKSSFFKLFGPVDNSFICLSGIPEDFFNDVIVRSYDSFQKFVFVGDLIKRKHPESLIKALRGYSDACVSIIGDGPEKDALKVLADQSGMSGSVQFAGKIPRSEVKDFLDEADCFVMISENETFGLVYVEAMARGCIVVASRGEGMDGVIKDGRNGFLCNAGDSDELSDIFKRVNAMSKEERCRISEAAVQTAHAMTDHEVAKEYLSVLESL